MGQLTRCCWVCQGPPVAGGAPLSLLLCCTQINLRGAVVIMRWVQGGVEIGREARHRRCSPDRTGRRLLSLVLAAASPRYIPVRSTPLPLVSPLALRPQRRETSTSPGFILRVGCSRRVMRVARAVLDLAHTRSIGMAWHLRRGGHRPQIMRMLCVCQLQLHQLRCACRREANLLQRRALHIPRFGYLPGSFHAKKSNSSKS